MQHMCLTKNSYPKYVKNFCRSIRKRQAIKKFNDRKLDQLQRGYLNG